MADAFLVQILVLLSVFSVGPWSCVVLGQPACVPPAFPFCNTSKAFAERAEDLISRLSLDEKLAQLGNSAPAIPRLGIPAYQWWQEALHGVAISLGVTFDGPIRAATSFPQTILTSASFNNTLFLAIGQVVSTEARAMYNCGQSGLTFWSPNVNIFRDPRWGRGQETSGEDPLLTSNYAANFLNGMQGGSTELGRDGITPVKDFVLKTSACCKHFTAYDLEAWNGVDRDHFDALVTKQDLEDTYNPPFQSCVNDGRASAIMCAYNRVNGVPSCASYDFLTSTVRDAWKLHGYIVSDCDAVYDMTNDPKYAESLEDAVAKALLAGMDLNCGITIANHGRSAVMAGILTEEMVDRALRNLFLVRMRLGLFDGSSQRTEYEKLGPQDVCTHEHQALALEAALQGFVLLKNDKDVLPLSSKSNLTLAILGPNADDDENRMLGNYAGKPCIYITPLEGLKKLVSKTLFERGCSTVSCVDHDFTKASAAAHKADAALIIIGLSQNEEREGVDRISLLLPGNQQELVSSVARASRGPVILVIMSGGPVDISFAKNDPLVSAILWIGYPGQAGGLALAKVIFGERSPGGRLPETWYPEAFMRVPMTNMHMRPNVSADYPGRSYRFYSEEPVFPFGHGLSYATFRHTLTCEHHLISAPTLAQQACYHGQRATSILSDCSQADLDACEHSVFQLQIGVKNEGHYDSDQVLLLFFAPPGAGEGGVPIRQLLKYKRVHLEAGSHLFWDVEISVCRDLTLVTTEGEKVVRLGSYQFFVGEAHQSLVIETEAQDVAIV